MTTSRRRTGVCAWCGTTFTARSRGRIPTYCKTSHRIRAYEERKMSAALALAEQGRAVPDRRPEAAEDIGPIVRVTTSDHSAAVAGLRAVAAEATSAKPTSASELRQSIATVTGAMRRVLAAAGLPEIEVEAAAWWSLVVPVSDALQRAESTVAAAPRSSRSLQMVHSSLLSAAAALADPEAHVPRFSPGVHHLAIAVPGPAGFAAGTFETDTVGRYKSVFWTPDGSYANEPLARLAGRPEGFRYRWDDKRVWEQLSHDMIVVACGWQPYRDRLPPALGRHASATLGHQLRQDLGATSEWAVHAHDIVKWLARSRLVTVVDPEALR